MRQFGALRVLFVHGSEAAQHFLLRGRKRRALEGQQCRQVSGIIDKLADASRAPRLIDKRAPATSRMALRIELLRFVKWQKVDACAIERTSVPATR